MRMNSTAAIAPREKSKYIKNTKELDAFRKTAVAFVFALYVLPQYFGIPNPIFDFTAVRITIVVLLAMVITDFKRNQDFKEIIIKEKVGLLLIPYLFVIAYTMVLRTDINAFLNPFIEILEMYILI